MSLLKTAEYNYKANQTSIAPKFDPQLSYTIGDLVMEGGNLYKAKTNISAGIWDESDWEVANMAELITSLPSDWISRTDKIHFTSRLVTDSYTSIQQNQKLRLLRIVVSLNLTSGIGSSFTKIADIDDFGITFSSGDIKIFTADYTTGIVAVQITNEKIQIASQRYSPGFFSSTSPMLISY